ncbi:tryptophan halogenase family protein [Brevundimonas sp. SORGH_AS_0993]|uniref:tryptophan halogenase family protein n=1 Tax=Brevundimonas sp. SORGH_AS_0993 TaxID=3041794 RepID=UPI00278368FC|nr:tryptophan halogenase family protein [Brevundimonas sp. SORGH_AS_0993]MDQ1153253.1 tryptophan halogenase [Brevundimonas sp. SORGH_AS_0993]
MDAPSKPIDRIVIVGGGTAGWMAAAALAHTFNGSGKTVTLVESAVIGIIGVGEATIPEILKFNARLGIDEADFLRETKATFKLGIEFDGWRREGERYFHPFGAFGLDMEGIAFHHFWLKARAEGGDEPLETYSMAWQAARRGRFAHPQGGPQSPLSSLGYAYHFDAGLYAAFLRRFAEGQGVVRHEGKVVEVRRGEDGDLSGLTLDDGRTIEGDFFIDCTGFIGLLIERTLEAGYEDWSRWLPCDSAVAVPCERAGPLSPYTRATAREAGWQWRIPLQHRVGNGYVYASDHISHDAAEAALMARLEGPALAEPRRLRFKTGRRRECWKRNCVAVGLSSGFLEPLESTSIHLIQSAITKLINLFPAKRDDDGLRATFNALMEEEFTTVRDFLILHYKVTERAGTTFWDEVRTMTVPDRLVEKIALFQATGRIVRRDHDIFAESSWLAVAVGQGVKPTGRHPVSDVLGRDENRGRLAAIRDSIWRTADALPSHEEALTAAMGVRRG